MPRGPLHELDRKMTPHAPPIPLVPTECSAASKTAEQARGLSQARAAELLGRDGPNEIVVTAPLSPLRVLGRQFQSPVVGLLLAACGVSALLGEMLDGVAIGVVVALNAIVGFLQEYRAEAAVQALRSLTARRARVLRDGATLVIPASAVVVGDVLSLEAGDVVAADARVLEAHLLSVNQASLTGESEPVAKSARAVASDAPLIEQSDRIFMGSSVARGAGLASVVAVGMRTELGRIAHLVESVQKAATPLEARLARVTRSLIYACLGIVTLVALLGLLRRAPPFEVLISAVSLAVAAIPEGLPALVTIALSLGVQRMAARQVLVRRMSAVETLGCTTVICTDKTGTLTAGEMSVRELWGEDEVALLDAAAACCDAELGSAEHPGVGDPTELALLAAAERHGIRRAEIERERPRIEVEPFDPETKRMRVLRADGMVYVKGALEAVLPLCPGHAAAVEGKAVELAARGLRVLAVASGRSDTAAQLTLRGLCALADPPRPEVLAAVAAARRAGVKVVMITGDHPTTAHAIARELGIVAAGESPEGLVHARTTPEQKLDIVRAWKSRGAIVAMTGDGVNDAPALREAHIGIAMGRSGTEVTREAADVLLSDDNFASIVAAVEEGRGIFDSIRKALVYLLGTNTAELALMLTAAVVGLPLPLLPIQLLWVNLVTDALPALALAMDPPAPDVLHRPPRDPAEPMIGRTEWLTVAVLGALLASTSLAAFLYFDRIHGLGVARSAVFSTLVFGQLGLALSARSAAQPYFRSQPLHPPALLLVVLGSLLAQLSIHQLASTRRIFQIEALSAADLLVVGGFALLPVTLVELGKLLRARRAAPVSRGH
jgi:Ca2+-transporting ATPase